MSKRSFVFDQFRFFPQCHASTLAQMPNGEFMSAWFAGSREYGTDTAIWGAKTIDGVWQDPQVIIKHNDEAHWNPVLFWDDEKQNMLLFFKTGVRPAEWNTFWGELDWESEKPELNVNLTSLDADDDAEPETSIHGRGPVRSGILQLSNGDWLAPASNEIVLQRATFTTHAVVIWEAFVDRSVNHGLTWKRTKFIPYDRNKFGKYGGVIQPTLWESSHGIVHMLLRSTLGYICRSDSDDYGRTWSDVYLTDLPNNNSGVDLVRTLDDVLVLCYNPVSEDWGPRTPISLITSIDNGKSWSAPVDLESGPGSFSYPFLILRDKRSIALTYTWNRTRITFGKFAMNKDGKWNIKTAINAQYV